MYLVIENSKKVYASFETERHFKQAEEYRRNLRRLPASVLDTECDLKEHGDNFYIVIPVSPAARRKTKPSKTKSRSKKPA
jgi:hypothetical protein